MHILGISSQELRRWNYLKMAVQSSLDLTNPATTGGAYAKTKFVKLGLGNLKSRVEWAIPRTHQNLLSDTVSTAPIFCEAFFSTKDRSFGKINPCTTELLKMQWIPFGFVPFSRSFASIKQRAYMLQRKKMRDKRVSDGPCRPLITTALVWTMPCVSIPDVVCL